MNCSCRTDALRIFIRSVVRVHAPLATPANGTRTYHRTLPLPPRHARRDGITNGRRTIRFPVWSGQRLSSTATLSEDITPLDQPADEPNPHAPSEGQASDDAVASRFPKALKAKKKQMRLAARPSPELNNTEPEVEQRAQVAEAGEHETEKSFEGTTHEGPPGRGSGVPKPVREKLPKNKRKREARAAHAIDRRTEEEPGSQAGSLPDKGKRPVKAQAGVGVGKREAREAKAHTRVREDRKSDDPEQDPASKKEAWQVQKAALREKFPEGWSPRKRLSPDALAGIRALHQQFPEEYTTDVLANKFEVSPEAIRRILKSRWEPAPEEEIERQERWFNRGKRIWSAWAEEGKKPPTKWRQEGITRDPLYHDERRARSLAQRKLAKTLM